MRASAIIVAAGSGTRLGINRAKAFVPVGGSAMVFYSLRAIARVPAIVELVIAVPRGMESEARSEVTRAALKIPVKMTPGGAERQDSVRIALALTSAESELVIVHDAARPFAPAALFDACLAAAARSGGAIAAIPVSDTLKRVADGAITATVPRADLWQAQTPQAFRRALLIEAHERALAEHVTATDDADLVERIGGRVEVVEGTARNFKITTRADLELADSAAAALMNASRARVSD
ncbi:MAG TPA: 2-C-methyl-D-erythritol 4-phosphate cytidylyltransferase [Candidatus Binataceae bacterium]|nr:2-C-methyl-D-erythritol 4-phosphate cytidylyltransferase [Candidatus Binataceae bacterium]